MLLPPLQVDLDAYEQQLAEALIASDTHIFIDTSVMIWLYGLGESARHDFINWVRSPAFSDRVSIPAWALHEFLGKVRDGGNNVFFPFDRQIKEFLASRERITALASLLVDEPWLKRSGNSRGREFYLGRLDRIFCILGKALSPLRTNLSAESVHKILFPFFNERALKSDIFSSIIGVQSEYEARSEGRIPPGFEDRNKRGRDEPEDESKSGANRFGDLVFWKEVIGKCKDSHAKSAIIISNDVKKDWIYQPSKFADLDGRIKPNNQRDSLKRVYLASPLLTHEIKISAGVEQLFVVNIYQLLPVLQRRNNLKVNALAQAAQIEFEARSAIDESEGAEQATPIGDFEPDAAAIEHPEHAPQYAETLQSVDAVGEATLSSRALADKTYSGGLDPIIDQTIADLKSLNWYVQNPAVKLARTRLRANAGDASQVFVLGRNIYQAACGGANEAQIFVERLWAETAILDPRLASTLVAGMFFEAYFDSTGKIRSKPKSDFLDSLLSLQSSTNLQSAVHFINQKLTAYRTKFLLIPSFPPELKSVSFAVDPSDSDLVSSIFVGGKAVTTQVQGSSFPGTFVPSGPIKIDRILQILAREFCTLPDQLYSEVPAEKSFRFRGDISFVEWGPNSNFDF